VDTVSPRWRCGLWAAALPLVLACSDVGPDAPAAARFALAPGFQSPAAGIVEIVRIRVQLFRVADESLALDRVVDVAPGADSVTLDLRVTVTTPDEAFLMLLAFITPAGDTAFRGGPVEVRPTGESAAPVPIEVPVEYVGVGANAASVEILTTDVLLFVGQTTTVTAQALDAAGTAIPGTPIAWSSLDPTLVSVPDPASGTVVAGAQPGQTGVVATLLTGPADTTLVTVALPAAPGPIVFAGDSSAGLSTGIFTVEPDGTKLTRVQTLPTLGFERQYPIWSPDRSRIAYSWDGGVFGPLQLYLTDATGSAVQAVVTDTSAIGPGWSPNGVHLAFECLEGSNVNVCVIPDVTGALGSIPVNNYLMVTDSVPTTWANGWSEYAWDPQNPDRIAFVRDSIGTFTVSMVWTTAFDGSGPQRLAPGGLQRPGDGAPLHVQGPLDFSPDGQQIVFAAYSPQDAVPEDKLFVINRDGTGLRQLTFLPGYDDSPLFSPTGTEVLFGRDISCSYDGWIVDINNTDGSLERRITDEQVCDFDIFVLGADWSPDGSQIVLTGFDILGNTLIYIVPRTVTAATYLTDRVLVGRGVDPSGFVQDIQPSWRP
jgi:Tol biopolymer transport system component